MKKTVSVLLAAIISLLLLCPLTAGAAVSISSGKDALLAQWETGSSHGISYKAFSPDRADDGRK
ncbi:MAG: hypothetical protein IJN68_04875 [Clostridia bacterium]|nr:hypothetical protein [Clostridia bacterium]